MVASGAWASHDLAPHLSGAVRGFAELVAGADPGNAVPSCPEWTVRDLVDHIGGVHQWARHAVVVGDGRGRPAAAPKDVCDDAAALAAWYLGHATDLLDAMSSGPPDAPAWVFGDGPATVAWWLRRQTHEVALHTWDLLAASDRSEEWRPEPTLAWDGVDEVATLFYPRQVRLGRTEPLPGTLLLEATDLSEAGTVRLGDGEPRVVVRADAADVLLMLWQRVAPTDDAAPLLAGRAPTP